jgi:hypothetical protein
MFIPRFRFQLAAVLLTLLGGSFARADEPDPAAIIDRMSQSIAALLPYDIVLEATHETVSTVRRKKPEEREARTYEVRDRSFLLTNRVLDLRDLKSGEIVKVRPHPKVGDHARSMHPWMDEGADLLVYLNPTPRRQSLLDLLQWRHDAGLLEVHDQGDTVRLVSLPQTATRRIDHGQGVDVTLAKDYGYLPRRIRISSFERTGLEEIVAIDNELAITPTGVAYPASGKGKWVHGARKHGTFSFKLDATRSRFGELDLAKYGKARKETGEGEELNGWVVWSEKGEK